MVVRQSVLNAKLPGVNAKAFLSGTRGRSSFYAQKEGVKREELEVMDRLLQDAKACTRHASLEVAESGRRAERSC